MIQIFPLLLKRPHNVLEELGGVGGGGWGGRGEESNGSVNLTVSQKSVFMAAMLEVQNNKKNI